MSEPEIHVAGDRVRVQEEGRTGLELPLGEWLRAVVGAVDRGHSCGALPLGVRIWIERGDFVGMALELQPQVRTVRWLSPSSRQPYGRGARYATLRLAFPFVVLLVVFRSGSLTGLQQLFFRCRPLDADDALFLPKLYNVAPVPRLPCWLCLAHLAVFPKPIPSWVEWTERLAEAVFSAPYNQSSEVNEGTSYWALMEGLDPRLATPEAWAAATASDPLFPLRVAWRPAGLGARAELERMLELAGASGQLRSAADLARIARLASARSASP